LPFQRIHQKTVVEEVRGQVLAMIRRGDLTPGAQLPPEKDLARILSVSRTALREALHIMVGEGLLEVRRGQGTFVREPSSSAAIQSEVVTLLLQPEDLEEVQEARRILEPEIAARVAASGTAEDFQRIEAVLDEMRRRADSGETIFEMAWDFHHVLAQASGNEVIAKLVDILYQMIWAAEKPLYERYFDIETEIDDHRALLEVIRRGSPDQARAAMLAHLVSVDEELHRALEADRLRKERSGVASPDDEP
jgi:GntR family transcriptional repressor for pyruvate dehydrogenase complex